MKELEELLNHFREWNRAWDKYKNNELNDAIKPTSKDVFISAMNELYKIEKK